MTWLAWRQIRTQTLVLFGVLVSLVALLRIAGAQQRHEFSAFNACLRTGCTNFSWSFNFGEELAGHYIGQGLIYALPVLTGMFWGAPLIARELSTGTARTAWTQSVTRTRWLGTKLAITGAASVVATGLLSLSAGWWFTPFSNFADDSRFVPAAYDVHGIAPIGYAALGFALGVLSGAIWRRTIPAMITTLLGYAVTRIAVTAWIRPNFQTPKTIVESANAVNASLDSNSAIGIYTTPPLTPSVNDWVTSTRIIEPNGRPYNVARTFCDGGFGGNPSSGNCSAQAQAYIDKLRIVIRYQPADRYWRFQTYETLLYTVVAALLVAATFWLLRRRSV